MKRFTRVLLALAVSVGVLTAVGVGATGTANAVVPCSGSPAGDYFDNLTATVYGDATADPGPHVYGVTTNFIAHTPTLCSGASAWGSDVAMLQTLAGGVMKVGQYYSSGGCNRFYYQALDKTGSTLTGSTSGGCLTDNSWYSVQITYNSALDRFQFLAGTYGGSLSVIYTTSFGNLNWDGRARLRFGTETNYTTSNVGGSASNPGRLYFSLYQISKPATSWSVVSAFNYTATPNHNPSHWWWYYDSSVPDMWFYTAVVQ